MRAAESFISYGGSRERMGIRRSSILTALAALLLVALAAVAANAATNANKKAAKKGADYLNSRSMTAFSYTGFKSDAVSALTAARKGGTGVSKSKTNSQINELIAELEVDAPNYGVTAGAAGKLLLAAVADGRRPRCFGPAGSKVDLVAMVNQYYDNGRYGESAFDQAFAMLGLAAAREKVPSKAVSLVKNRRKKHGWNFALSTSTGDDVESTALIIQALRAAGVKSSDSSIKNGFKWMRFQRNAQEGYNNDTAGGETNANASALVIQAYDALGKPSSKPKLALRKLQAKDGHFKLTAAADAESKVLATSDSVLALAGMHYPVVKRSKKDSVCSEVGK